MKSIRGHELRLCDLNAWFQNYYKWVNQALMAERLGKAWEQHDKTFGLYYSSVAQLDAQAEVVRQEILHIDAVAKAKWEANKQS